MAYRTGELDIPPDDPFRHDRLDRKDAVEFMADLIGRAGGPFVVAIDGPWGTGKTTFVRMLHAHLTKAQFLCVSFNAWEVDYVIDPLVALVSAIDRVSLTGQSEATFRERIKTVRKVTTLVAKRGAVAAVKALTVGALDLEEEVEGAISEFAGESLGDIVGAFQKEKELLIRFRTELEEAIKLLPASGKKPTLIFFVDELDRCRPTFAVELLERVKHLFNVGNLVFVLAIDKAQLEASTSAIYGNNINAAEYLRRFIDIDFAIPQVKGRQYTEGLVELFNLDALFSERAHPALQNDRDNFIRFFTALADVFQLSLRARERCFTRMRLVMDQTPKDHYLDPVLVALLVVLRAKEPRMFADLVGGEISAHDVMQLLARHPGGRAFVADRMGVVLEAYLMLADENEKRVADRHVELKGTIEAPRTSIDSPDRARELVAMCRNLSSGMRSPIKLRVLARKIDLAANVRD
jgi:KAP family P-loop domain